MVALHATRGAEGGGEGGATWRLSAALIGVEGASQQLTDPLPHAAAALALTEARGGRRWSRS